MAVEEVQSIGTRSHDPASPRVELECSGVSEPRPPAAAATQTANGTVGPASPIVPLAVQLAK